MCAPGCIRRKHHATGVARCLVSVAVLLTMLLKWAATYFVGRHIIITEGLVCRLRPWVVVSLACKPVVLIEYPFAGWHLVTTIYLLGRDRCVFIISVLSISRGHMRLFPSTMPLTHLVPL